MIFATYWFACFALVVVPCYWLIPRAEWRLWFLAAACLTFHAHFAGPAGMAPIIVLMIMTYIAGLTRSRAGGVGVMVLCVAALCAYKYNGFLVDSAVGWWSPSSAAHLKDLIKRVMPRAAPLGISFFVFEFVHYLYELRKGDPAIRHPLRFLLFAIFFPSLVAGPIKRYTQFLPSLAEGSQGFRIAYLGEGLFRIGVGFAKKIIIADNLTSYVEHTQPQFASLSLGGRWLVLGAISTRILMDFSGYSDIAIGLARLLGVTLPENFNWPYLARNLRDFWLRWHISLSLWIRDYVYIPLGGSRHGPLRRLANVLVAFALCGLWHGPSWHFAVWGLYHGVGLGLCSSYESIPELGPALRRLFAREPMAGLAVTQVYAWIGWLLFFYPVSEALTMARLLFTP
jgi:alginate O-acetyltransferase complex protein AlgI